MKTLTNTFELVRNMNTMNPEFEKLLPPPLWGGGACGGQGVVHVNIAMHKGTSNKGQERQNIKNTHVENFS